MSVTRFKGFVSQLFFSCTGTFGYSSSPGSAVSHAQSAFQAEMQVFPPHLREPSLEKDDGSVGQQTLGVGILRRFRIQSVGINPQGIRASPQAESASVTRSCSVSFSATDFPSFSRFSAGVPVQSGNVTTLNPARRRSSIAASSSAR